MFNTVSFCDKIIWPTYHLDISVEFDQRIPARNQEEVVRMHAHPDFERSLIKRHMSSEPTILFGKWNKIAGDYRIIIIIVTCVVSTMHWFKTSILGIAQW